MHFWREDLLVFHEQVLGPLLYYLNRKERKNISSICTLVAPEPCVEAAVFGVGGTGFGSD